ncbi:MAG: arylsulfatase [Bacteroidota bacterium]|nr:arylsulfatase [Bacteroidota bacterium]
MKRNPIPCRMLIAAGLLVIPHICVMAQDEAPPNIVVLLADDLGYGDLGAYGQKKIKTPHLDRMASDGVRFKSFYAGHTVCAPSRVALLTGTDMAHSHTRSNRGPGLREEDVTIAEVLKDAGYATGVFGKWGFGSPERGAPDRQGFDEFFGYLGHVHAHSHYTDHLFAIEEGRTVRVEIDTTAYTHDLFMDRALNFIDRHQNEPFFLYLPFALVHAELLVPEDSMEPYQDSTGRSILMPETPFPCCGVIGTYRGQSQPHAAFAGMVGRLDRDVGRIMDQLTALELDRNTIVLFTSDNGPHVEGGADPGFFESNGPLRGLKRDLYEGGIRVPMIAWGPGLLPGGRVSDHPWGSWDLLATVGELSGVEVPVTNGLSMAGLLTGNGPAPLHRYFYWEFDNTWGQHYVQAIRSGDWKLLRFTEPDLSWDELYNLEDDIGEYNDLSAHYPAVVDRLTRLIAEVRTEP